MLVYVCVLCVMCEHVVVVRSWRRHLQLQEAALVLRHFFKISSIALEPNLWELVAL